MSCQGSQTAADSFHTEMPGMWGGKQQTTQKNQALQPLFVYVILQNQEGKLRLGGR